MNNDLIWKKIDSQEIHRNPWYKIMQDNVLMPSGQMGKYTYIDRSPGVIIAAIDENKNIYLVGQYRYPIQKLTWELPMGTLESGESDLLEAAKRELREEVGAEAKKWTMIGEFYYCAGLSNQKGHVFLAQELEVKIAQPDYTEFLTGKKVNLAEINQMIINGEMMDSPSLCALSLLQTYLKNN